MNIPISVNQSQLLDVLLNVAVIRPVFIWGAPGIGKLSIVERFADSLGLPCVSLLGSQLAPEEVSRPRELPPEPLAEPYVNLSAHTAPIIQPKVILQISSVQTILCRVLRQFQASVPLFVLPCVS